MNSSPSPRTQAQKLFAIGTGKEKICFSPAGASETRLTCAYTQHSQGRILLTLQGQLNQEIHMLSELQIFSKHVAMTDNFF